MFGAGAKAKQYLPLKPGLLLPGTTRTLSMLLSKQNQPLSLSKGSPGSYTGHPIV